MGFKRRSFTATLKAEILEALADGEALTKRELLDRLRPVAEAQASVRRLSLALGRLVAADEIQMVGKRAAARFQRVRPATED